MSDRFPYWVTIDNHLDPQSNTFVVIAHEYGSLKPVARIEMDRETLKCMSSDEWTRWYQTALLEQINTR